MTIETYASDIAVMIGPWTLILDGNLSVAFWVSAYGGTLDVVVGRA
ncbi:MAG: hypothetical protein AAGE52_01395 [Myxococcota bacterium]